MRIDSKDNTEASEPDTYTIVSSKFEDHMKLELRSGSTVTEVTVALPDSTKAAYISITGEHCIIEGISAEKTGDRTGPEDIERIADEVRFIDRMESDIRNVQVDRTRSASTDGVLVTDGMRLDFHTMSLPTAGLVWHCPYIILFYSKDGKVGGEGYVEYTLIKLNGEHNMDNEGAVNKFVTRKDDRFPGWEGWKQTNKRGMECEIEFNRRKNRITLKTENLGVMIENTLTVLDGPDEVYVALTGDQVALTDIRVRA